MARTTFEIPDDLHGEVASLVRKLGLNMSTAVEQALRLWTGSSVDEIGRMSGPLAKLSSRERKRVNDFIELMRTGQDDIKKCAIKRTLQFLAIARDELRSR